jgi:hypothetical protein
MKTVNTIFLIQKWAHRQNQQISTACGWYLGTLGSHIGKSLISGYHSMHAYSVSKSSVQRQEACKSRIGRCYPSLSLLVLSGNHVLEGCLQ